MNAVKIDVKIDGVLRLQDFGLESLQGNEAIVGFARRAEARIARRLDCAHGALLMLMVPGDPESGCMYIYEPSREAFYSLALPIDGRFGGSGKMNLMDSAMHLGSWRSPAIPVHCEAKRELQVDFHTAACQRSVRKKTLLGCVGS